MGIRAKKNRRFSLPSLFFFSTTLLLLASGSKYDPIYAQNSPSSLVISGFNAMFLYDEEGDRTKFPPNRRARKPSDFAILRDTVLQNSPDIIGFQEIENESALRKVTTENYGCAATKTHGYSQEVGLCWKKSLPTPLLSELPQLSLRPGLRKGIMAEFSLPLGKLTVIVVHLKAGHGNEDQYERHEQLKALGEILSHRKRFVLIGDFNENLKSKKASWNLLKGELFLRSANHKASSDCWQHQKGFIDYLITDMEWNTSSFRQFKFKADDGKFDGNPPEEMGLSDHCPISAELIWESERKYRARTARRNSERYP